MKFRRRLQNACMALVPLAAGFLPAAGWAQGAGEAALAPALQQVDEYCVTCHNFDDFAGGLDLSGVLHEAVPGHAETWEKVIRKLRAGMMPPPGQPRPEWDDYQKLTVWLEDEIDQAAEPYPGTVMMHRLNRSEYANAIRDLLGLEVDVTTLLPADTSARGFDNIAGSLTLSPTLLEAYATAASRIARMAVGFWETPTEMAYIAPGDTSQNMHLQGLPFGTRGGMKVEHNFPADGEYLFHIQNFGVGSFTPGEQLELSIDGERVHLFEYTGVGLASGMGGDRDGALEVRVPVKAGTRVVGATFLATQFRPSLGLIQQYDRKSIENNDLPQVQYHPAIGLLKILGPFNAQRPQDSESMRKVFTCRPANADEAPACARQILGGLARRAYRRPVTDSDLVPLLTFYENGSRQSGSFEDGIELALRRLLIDPEFLVRVEKVPDGVAVGEDYPISDLELASRLSFFLWSSIPDEELIDLASAGRLHEPAELERQVKRMLADPRASALVENFAQQWLYLRNLPTTNPDGIYFPDWDDELRQAFQRETELLFGHIITADRSILDLLDANYTFVNERLAEHYGIPNIYGSHFRQITLPPELDYRRGILGKGSFLSVAYTQNFRTSPVKRGVWVLENVLGTPPPAMPANVPGLEETTGGEIRNLRDQMSLHRQNEPCATCHKIMDGIGFALENFDASGKWRDLEGHPRVLGGAATPIDATVELWDGSVVTGPAGLRENILKYSPQFVRFATEKLMTYALGRGVEYYDMPVIRDIVEQAEAVDYRFSALVMGVVLSPQFRMRTKVQEETEDFASLTPAG